MSIDLIEVILQKKKKNMSHNCRCNKCKSVIYAMLSRIYGDIEFKPKFKNVSVRLEDYEGSRFYRSLSKIYYALSKYHGYTDFVRSKGLNPSDLYIPKKKILIETDEVQHFTAARFFALKNYPRSFELAYNIKVYRQMCKEINAKDGAPEYRDEQRAWYDTIRDFLPRICPDQVTQVVRIPLGFYPWCSLDPNNPSDVRLFKKLLKSEEIWQK